MKQTKTKANEIWLKGRHVLPACYQTRINGLMGGGELGGRTPTTGLTKSDLPASHYSGNLTKQT
jgi:hypothetical protein